MINVQNDPQIVLDRIAEIDWQQKAYIKRVLEMVLTDDEYKALLSTIKYYFQQGYSVDDIAEAYLLLVKDIRNEMLWFRMNGCSRYRYSTLAEIENEVYYNDAYMNRRMIGLQIADYLWENHVRIRRFYSQILRKMSNAKSIRGGKRYLEIGPGDGQYFAEAVKRGGFHEYVAIDVSPQSCNMTKALLRSSTLYSEDVKVLCGDFRELLRDQIFDMVCLSEVLEHVENPMEMLKEISRITADDAYLYVHIPINAPSIWHIYLFHTVEEVKDLIQMTGYKVIDELVVTAGGRPIEEAICSKTTINYAALLRKRERG